MSLLTVIVCVNYDDLLGISLPSIIREVGHDLDNEIVVVTSRKDSATVRVGQKAGVCVFQTDAFYTHGAAFSKAAALNAVLEDWRTCRPEWVLTLDADIVFQPGMGRVIEAEATEKNVLYGASRVGCSNLEAWENGGPFPPIKNPCELPGFLHCFWTGQLSPPPWYDAEYEHAGGYDSAFQKRWDKAHKKRFSLPVIHLGNLGENWYGRLTERWQGKSVGAPSRAAISRVRQHHAELKVQGVPGRDRKEAKL